MKEISSGNLQNFSIFDSKHIFHDIRFGRWYCLKGVGSHLQIWNTTNLFSLLELSKIRNNNHLLFSAIIAPLFAIRAFNKESALPPEEPVSAMVSILAQWICANIKFLNLPFYVLLLLK